MERFAAVYSVRCVATGEVYIGSSRHVARRLDEHRHLLRRGGHPYQRLQRAWDEVGEGGFTFEVLEVVDVDTADLGAQELLWMNRVNHESAGSLVNGEAPRPHVSHARPAWTEHDADGTREAILDAGQKVFAQCGFSGARVDEIAKVAGYNKALLYYYFGDKQGLYRAVMSRVKKQIVEQLGGTIERFTLASDEAPRQEDLSRFITESFQWVSDDSIAHPEAAQMLAWEAAEGWQTFSSCEPLISDIPWAEHITAYLRQAQAAGVLRPELDAELLIATMMSLPLIHLLSLPHYAQHTSEYNFDSPEALAQAREQVLALVLHGTLTTPEGN